MQKILFAMPEAEPTSTQREIRATMIEDLRHRGFAVENMPADHEALADPSLLVAFDALAADVTQPDTQAEHAFARVARKLGAEVLFYTTQIPNGGRFDHNGKIEQPNRATQLRADYTDAETITVRSASTPAIAVQAGRLFALRLTNFAEIHLDMAAALADNQFVPLPPETGTAAAAARHDAQLFITAPETIF